jgi:hypothetical protein
VQELSSSALPMHTILMPSDRRWWPRLSLRYGIRLYRPDNQEVAVTAQTDNLSGQGFYCVSEEPFSPGDHLQCELLIPAPHVPSANLTLHRRVRVLRLEIKGLEPGYWIACQFEDSLADPEPTT